MQSSKRLNRKSRPCICCWAQTRSSVSGPSLRSGRQSWRHGKTFLGARIFLNIHSTTARAARLRNPQTASWGAFFTLRSASSSSAGRSRTGSDVWHVGGRLEPVRFLSTLPHGERRYNPLHAPMVFDVSIHAPARGATRLRSSHPHSALFLSTLPHGERPTSFPKLFNSLRFLSTLPHGERRRARPSGYRSLWFLSTLPHGERRERRTDRSGERSFYPRSRTGSDGSDRRRGDGRHCFFPRSRTGSDVSDAGGSGRNGLVSIHAPARGATSSPLSPSRSASCFYPRSRTGG